MYILVNKEFVHRGQVLLLVAPELGGISFRSSPTSSVFDFKLAADKAAMIAEVTLFNT